MFKKLSFLLAVLLLCMAGRAQSSSFITDVMLIGAENATDLANLKAQYQGQGWQVLDYDLNKGIPWSQGNGVLLLYKTASYNGNSADCEYITDLYLQNRGASSTTPTLTHNGRTYHLAPYAGHQHFLDVMGDLNSGTGWNTDAIHLYYTKESFPDHRGVTSITVNTTQSGAVGREGGSTGYNLNAGCSSGDNIYLHFTTAAVLFFAQDDLYYRFNSDNTSVTVFGHTSGTEATGSLVIPASVNHGGTNYAVTAIGDSAFYLCWGFTGSLTIPNSVTTIGVSAFEGCSDFTGSLTIPNSVTTIGVSAFEGCIGFTGSLTLGTSVTTIGDGAFEGCIGFTGSLTLGTSVTGWRF